MATRSDVMVAIFGAFAGFSAFGTVIATFLVSGNALQRIAARWGAHGIEEALKLRDRKARKAGVRRALRRRVVVLWSAGILVTLAALVSALGLLASFWWLHTHTRGGSVGWGWTYKLAGYLLAADAFLITVITALTMAIAVWSAVKDGAKTEDFIRAAARRRPLATAGSGPGASRARRGSRLSALHRDARRLSQGAE